MRSVILGSVSRELAGSAASPYSLCPPKDTATLWRDRAASSSAATAG
jgi:hypothetical protein